MMKSFCSWSGGKDSCLALYKAIEDFDCDVRYLVNMVNTKEKVGHGLNPSLIEAQADAMSLEIFQKRVTWDTYEKEYKETVKDLDVNVGVFGDMEVEEHREWVERVCEELGIEPILPLWQEDPIELYREFIENFETKIIKIDKELIDERWLGKTLDEEFLNYTKENDIHPMGENGEYHTFIVDGVLFEDPVDVKELNIEEIEDQRDLILNLGL